MHRLGWWPSLVKPFIYHSVGMLCIKKFNVAMNFVQYIYNFRVALNIPSLFHLFLFPRDFMKYGSVSLSLMKCFLTLFTNT